MKENAKYRRLSSQLRQDISQGIYRVGEKIPGENELAIRYAMSRQTVRQALTLLEQEQVIERRQGSGTYVKPPRKERKRTWNVGVVATYISEYIFPSILRGMENELSESGFFPLLGATQNRVDNERRILQEYLEKGVDGLIVEGTKSALPNPNLEYYEAFREREIPVVFFNGVYRGLDNVVSVTMDDRAGGASAVHYLAAKGHRNIGGLFKSDDMQGLERYAGFQQGLLEDTLPLRDEWVHWFDSEMKRQMMEGDCWLEECVKCNRECTAMVCYNDEVAVRLLKTLERMGISVPQEMAVISFDNSMFSEVGPMGITSLDHPKELLGACVARKLVNMMEGRREGSTAMSWGLSQRESTCIEKTENKNLGGTNDVEER